MSRQTDFAKIQALKGKVHSWRMEANLWRKRTAEAAKAVEKYEDVCATNTRLREAMKLSRDHFNNKDFFTANAIIDKALKE